MLITVYPVLCPEPERKPLLAYFRVSKDDSLGHCHLTSWRCPRNGEWPQTPISSFPPPASAPFAEPWGSPTLPGPYLPLLVLMTLPLVDMQMRPGPEQSLGKEGEQAPNISLSTKRRGSPGEGQRQLHTTGRPFS